MDNLIMFAKNRFSRTAFVGLPLTILILICLGMTLLFHELSEEVSSQNVITTFDFAVTHFLYSNRSVDIGYIFLWITYFGGAQAISVIALGLSFLFLSLKKRLYILSLFVTLAGMSITVYIVKLIVGRDRPGNDIAYYIEDTFSFPSGHSAGAIALYGFVIYVLMRHLTNRVSKSLVLLIGIVIILLIGVSRLYLGVHYVSDVVGGYVIGLIWLLISIIATEISVRKRKQQR